MQPVAPPYGEARDDYAIFADLAERLGTREAFTEGRNVRQWLEHLYEPTRQALAEHGSAGAELRRILGERRPDHAATARRWRAAARVSATIRRSTAAADAQRQDRDFLARPSRVLARPDCPGHPAWLAPVQVPAPSAPLILVANQPATRLHSQLDFGGHSAAPKHRGREVARMHPADAAARGIADGDIIRLFNERGACLAGVRVTDDIRQGVIQLATGAWYDPADPEEDSPALRARQPERPDAGCRHVVSGAGLHRATDHRRGRAFHRQSAADPGLRSAGSFKF